VGVGVGVGAGSGAVASLAAWAAVLSGVGAAPEPPVQAASSARAVSGAAARRTAQSVTPGS
jgi:hypothetical protein